MKRVFRVSVCLFFMSESEYGYSPGCSTFRRSDGVCCGCGSPPKTSHRQICCLGPFNSWRLGASLWSCLWHRKSYGFLQVGGFESGGPKNICFPIKDTVISSENELDDFNFGPPLWDSLKWFSWMILKWPAFLAGRTLSCWDFGHGGLLQIINCLARHGVVGSWHSSMFPGWNLRIYSGYLRSQWIERQSQACWQMSKRRMT